MYSTIDAEFVTTLNTLIYRLHDEIAAFYRYVCPTDEERRAQQLVTAEVVVLIKRRFQRCEVVTFGSIAHGLSLPGG